MVFSGNIAWFHFSFVAYPKKRLQKNKSRTYFSSIAAELRRFAVAIAARAFLFPLSAQRKRNKKKSAGCRSGAKIFTLSLKKKNSLRSNSFFFFTGKSKNFFTLLHRGRKKPLLRLTHRFARWCECIRSMLLSLLLNLVIVSAVSYRNIRTWNGVYPFHSLYPIIPGICPSLRTI